MTTALLVVDVQNDFCEGGTLAVRGGAAVAAEIGAYVAAHHGEYATVAATADWHVDPGEHWSSNPDFVDTWPVHCQVGTAGADFHPDAQPAIDAAAAVFRKGKYAAAYSGFEGKAEIDGRPVGLADWLRAQGVDSVDLVGLTTDHCVRATALDAVAAGLVTRVLLGLTAGVAADTTARALEEMQLAGVVLEGSPVVTNAG